MWLHLDPKNIETDFNHTDNGHAEEQMQEVLTTGETHSPSPPVCGSNVVDLRSIGQVEISDEATLEDLKTQVKYVDHSRRSQINPLTYFRITSSVYCSRRGAPLAVLYCLPLYQVLTLPALQNVCVPTTAFMRIWQLEGRRLTRILRGQQLTLR